MDVISWTLFHRHRWDAIPPRNFFYCCTSSQIPLHTAQKIEVMCIIPQHSVNIHMCIFLIRLFSIFVFDERNWESRIKPFLFEDLRSVASCWLLYCLCAIDKISIDIWNHSVSKFFDYCPCWSVYSLSVIGTIVRGTWNCSLWNFWEYLQDLNEFVSSSSSTEWRQTGEVVRFRISRLFTWPRFVYSMGVIDKISRDRWNLPFSDFSYH
jgi:hypothetical protein